MTRAKITLSLEKSLSQKVEAVAAEMGLPRSQLFALALEESLERHRNQKLLREINEVYGEAPGPEGHKLRQAMRRHQQRIVEDRE